MIIDYYVEIKPIINKNGFNPQIFVIDQFKTENLSEDANEISKEILEFAKDNLKDLFPNAEEFIVTNIQPAFSKAEQNSEIYKESYSLWKEYHNSNEYKLKNYANMCDEAIKWITHLRQYAIDNNLLDSQNFINFMDQLNELSIDPDRK